MQQGRKRPNRAGILLLLLVTSVACGSTQPDAGYRRLEQTVEALQAQVARLDARLEDVSNRLVVRENVVVAPVTAMSSSPVPPRALEVVRLKPAASETVAAAETVLAPPVEITVHGNGAPVVTSQPSTTASAGSGRATSDRGLALFTRALRTYGRGQPRVARGGFETFVARYPRHPKVADGRFWLGVCQFELGDLASAVGSFRAVIEKHTQHPKVPEARLKLALALEELGRFDDARATFAEVVRFHPHSATAEVARARLSSQGGAP